MKPMTFWATVECTVHILQDKPLWAREATDETCSLVVYHAGHIAESCKQHILPNACLQLPTPDYCTISST